MYQRWWTEQCWLNFRFIHCRCCCRRWFHHTVIIVYIRIFIRKISLLVATIIFTNAITIIINIVKHLLTESSYIGTVSNGHNIINITNYRNDDDVSIGDYQSIFFLPIFKMPLLLWLDELIGHRFACRNMWYIWLIIEFHLKKWW